jgi:hypothetical protein
VRYTRQNPSPAYRKALAEATEHHANSKTYSGKFLRPHAPFIRELLRGGGFTGHALILDYGCGKGEQYRWVSHGDDASIPKGQTIPEYLKATIHLYDPAWPPYAFEPGQDGSDRLFDMTLVTHVLGSIPVQDLEDWVIPWVIALTHPEGIVYIAEKLGEVRKDVFSDTVNLPRWDAQQWRYAAMRWSAGTDTEIVLSLRHRGEGETIVERFRYNKGQETKWIWTPQSTASTSA